MTQWAESLAGSFADAALVLLGHGTATNAGSSAAVFQHAAELRRRRWFGEVREAFWKQAPRLTEVLAGLEAPRVFVVPLFASEGYFSERLIPGALGLQPPGAAARSRVRQEGGQRLFYCKPVGTHEGMTGVLLARAREVAAQFPFPRAPAPADTTLFVAGHGTGRDEHSRQAVERQAQLIGGLGLYAEVRAVFLEEEPRLHGCWKLAQTSQVIVVPFFISEGLHVQEDIPVLLGEAKAVVQQRLRQGRPAWSNPAQRGGQRVWLSPSVGTDPRLAEIIVERVRQAAGDMTP
jgi:sirohydrochlorin cobaltochelatase